MIRFSLVSPAGDEIALATSVSDAPGFALLDEAAGFGLADRDVKITASATGDGGRLRAVRVPPRAATLTILVEATRQTSLRTNFRRLAAAVRSIDGLPLPKLRAAYDTGEVYEVGFVYVNGADDAAGQAGGPVLEVPLNVIFPDPYWSARDAVSLPPFSGQIGTEGLLPYLSKMPLSPSTASGEVQVKNEGDAAAYPVWVLKGPFTSATVKRGTATWVLRNVTAAEVVTIDTRSNKVTLASGTNVYDRLDPAPKLWTLPAGTSTVSVVIAGGDSTTRVSCFYRPRLEVVL